MRLQRGFSLVELMIAVAIIGILASLAIPTYTGMQLKAKRSELAVNVAGIKDAEEAYDATFDEFVACATNPYDVPGKHPVAWGDEVPGFDDLGWRPTGDVRGQYSVALDEADAEDFEVIGQSDVDGDGHYADLRATAHDRPRLFTNDDVF